MNNLVEQILLRSMMISSLPLLNCSPCNLRGIQLYQRQTRAPASPQLCQRRSIIGYMFRARNLLRSWSTNLAYSVVGPFLISPIVPSFCILSLDKTMTVNSQLQVQKTHTTAIRLDGVKVNRQLYLGTFSLLTLRNKQSVWSALLRKISATTLSPMLSCRLSFKRKSPFDKTRQQKRL
ncbi:hypothetical protein FGO68_gene13082 [Halteria grandinella]|uniref:Uncharacterized protein n=1 Tax=Halteria grandinella TaxID=5974 RepID=A0A8J8NMR2_HALGN|nr:hypothetical protein FGO68_gene13082 [Halteria grandinella]